MILLFAEVYISQKIQKRPKIYSVIFIQIFTNKVRPIINIGIDNWGKIERVVSDAPNGILYLVSF